MFIPGFLSHPQNVYPSYLTPPLSLTPSNIAMTSLALSHHANPQNMRLSSPQHPNGTTLSAQMLATHRHTPPNQIQLQSVQQQQQQQSLPPITPMSTTLSSPQNLTTSAQSTAQQPISGRLSNSRILTPSSSASPENLSNSNDKLITTPVNVSDDNDPINELVSPTNSKEIALNMTMNNSDMRTNSIATLRIKAKEHLESINKGLAMA